ncbi:MAG: alpha-galactosidase, partial [Pseudomonadota bacterium]
LDGADQTLVLIGEGAAVPRLLWLGERLPDGLDAESLAALRTEPLAHATVDAPPHASIFPVLANGHAGPPALRAHRGGRGFGHRPVLDTVSVESDSLRVQLSDPGVGMAVTVRVRLDPTSGVCVWSTELQNTGNDALTIDWLAAASLELPVGFGACEHFGGRWGQELQCQRLEIDAGPLLKESWRGRTGHQSYPGVVVGEANFDCHRGDCWVAQLGWSGNHKLQLQRDDHGVPVLQFGVAFHPGECELGPGESVTTPPVYIATGAGRDRASQRVHRHARGTVLPRWTRKRRPIHSNSWEALYFNHQADTLRALIDAAAAAGAERFVLDDGWFNARRSDTAGLGDWWVDESVYPEGLRPVVDAVRAHGMQFGLWFEPEMVNPDSDTLRAHPEWVLRLDGVETPLARQQLALDLSRADVCDYLYERVAGLVDEYAIDYIKWDMNRDLVLPGNGARSVAARQPEAVRELMARLTTRFPRLEIETCASGGARLDWGLLAECGRVWLSDNLDPIDRLRMQAAASVFLPREVLGSHVGHHRAHLTGRQTPIATRAIVALGGQYGFETDLRTLAPDDLEVLAHYTAVYKAHRDWLAESTQWTLAGLPATAMGEARVSPDAAVGLLSVVMLAAPPQASPGCLRMPGLDRDARYRVAVANHGLEELAPFNRSFPTWVEGETVAHGAVLATVGLTLPVMPAQTALLVLVLRDE